MTEPTQPRTYRTRTGRLLTDADIERIVDEVETTDFDPARAKILYPPDAPQPARDADTEEVATTYCDVEQVRTRIKRAGT